MKLSDIVQSAEFAMIARISSVAAVVIGAVAGVAMMLAAIIVSDMRDDVKKSREELTLALGTLRVHESIVSDHGRRLGALETAVFTWRPTQRM